MKTGNRSRTVLAVVGVSMALTSCGQAERDYAVPEKVCGAAVEESALAPLLPPGEKLKESERESSGFGTTHHYCSLIVDRSEVVSIDVRTSDRTLAPEDWTTAVASYPHSAEADLGISGARAVVGSHRALVSAQCQGRSPYLTFDIWEFGDTVEASEKGAKILQTFTKEYVLGVKKKLECTV
ncbi:hypothetical protein QCN29_03210 [Streptomyces sp. HNM0663]|uniref:DUF3558 domain-containing protein n=1 Tax=Streptomyces chengmaiensis TaxID=3040919 RepID=A0ABT6HHP3_9ACTN|nr:hypothetical protein [Streptomyces chengmaiensis]MDH2387812.1 hypothetical protein [Streptomyces chengmaiensis]